MMNSLRIGTLFFLFASLAWTQTSDGENYEQLLLRANDLYKEGKLPEALGAVQAAGKLEPERYEAPALAALIFHTASRPAEAQAALTAALKLAPAGAQEKVQAIAGLLAQSAEKPAAPATPAVAAAQSASADPTALTGAAKRRYNTLMLIAEEADKAKLAEERNKLLAEYLEKSAEFVQEQPDMLPIWLIRAVAAMELNRSRPGREAARRLMQLGAEDSTDPKVSKILAMLDRKGWITNGNAIAGAGEPRLIADLGLTLVWIEEGEFDMGSATGGDDNERPVTRVTLTKPFWLGKTEVTQGQWQTVMGTTIRQQRDKSGPTKLVLPSTGKLKGKSEPIDPNRDLYGVGADYPIYYVSWDEAVEFCRKLTERERTAERLPKGYAYMLPTEAQWEYACRAYTTGDYAGNLDAIGWYTTNSGGISHPVAQKQANAWGLHDMHGNVWEWCADWHADQLRGGGVSDPKGAASGSYRINRGGGWRGNANYCRSASRSGSGPGVRYDALGFRLALGSVQ